MCVSPDCSRFHRVTALSPFPTVGIRIPRIRHVHRDHFTLDSPILSLPPFLAGSCLFLLTNQHRTATNPLRMAGVLSFDESSINPVLVSLSILLLVRSLIACTLVMMLVGGYSSIPELTEANLVSPYDRDLQRLLSPSV